MSAKTMIGLALLLFALPLAAATAQDQVGLSARIEDSRVDAGIPSISVAVSRCGRPDWVAAFGQADLETHRPATPYTRYSLASVTKPITAVAIMMLAEEGRLAIDQPANRYLGKARLVARIGDADDATIQRLMDHTAGLPPYYSLYYADEAFRRRTPDEAIARYGKIMIVPGTTERYSNLGYGVLERIIENASGSSYDRFVVERIFTPLGLRGVIATSSDLPADAAARYAGGGRRTPGYDTDTRAAASGFLTASDLAGFGRFLLDALGGRSRLLSKASAERMIKFQNAFADPDDYSGLGLSVSKRNGHIVFGHAGSMPGVTAQLFIAPEQCLVVATLLNGYSKSVRDTTLDLVLGHFAPELASNRSAPALSADISGRWAGTIELDDGRVIAAELDLTQAGTAFARIEGDKVAVQAIEKRGDGYYVISLDGGALPTDDARRQPYRLSFRLKPDAGRLSGFVMTVARGRADRDGGTFSYWSEFRRPEGGDAR